MDYINCNVATNVVDDSKPKALVETKEALVLDAPTKDEPTWKRNLAKICAFDVARLDEVVGGGEAASDGCVATVNYEGRLMSSGRVFDSSKGKGPIKFVLGEGSVIPAWDEGIASMSVGGKRVLRCPAALAYGEFGSGSGMIPPNADLEFDCELVNVAEGPVAVLAAKLSIGYNLRTAILGLLVLSFILPVVFPDVAWLH